MYIPAIWMHPGFHVYVPVYSMHMHTAIIKGTASVHLYSYHLIR